MKKFIAVICSIALAMGAGAAFIGCNAANENGGDSGYVEASKESFGEAIQSIDMDKLVGEVDPENFKLGFQLKAGFNVQAKIGQLASASASTNASIELVTTDPEFEDVKASGNASGKYSYSVQSEDGSLSDSVNYSAKLYVAPDEEGALYAYGLFNNGKQDLTAKLNVFSLIGALPHVAAYEDEAPAEGEDDFGFDDVYEMLTGYKVGVYVDTSNGVKVKLHAGAETFWAIVADNVESDMLASVKSMVDVKKFSVDIYVEVGSDGVLKEVRAVVDIKIEVKAMAAQTLDEEYEDAIPEEGEGEGGDMLDAVSGIIAANGCELSVSGNVSIKLYSGDVNAPSGMTGLDSYVDMTEALGGLIGGEDKHPDDYPPEGPELP